MKSTCYVFDQPFLQSFDGKYCSATASLVLILYCHFYNLGEIILSQYVIFFKFICQVHDIAKMHNYDFDFFNHQIIANLPQKANEMKRFLKYVQSFGFMKKVDFSMKNLIFSKIGERRQICCTMCIISFHQNLRFFMKIRNFGKIC